MLLFSEFRKDSLSRRCQKKMTHRKEILRKKDKPNKTPVSSDTDPLFPAPLKFQDILNDTASNKQKSNDTLQRDLNVCNIFIQGGYTKEHIIKLCVAYEVKANKREKKD